MFTYRTMSGSVYEVRGNEVRRVQRSKLSTAERVAPEWRTAEHIECRGIGHPLIIVWGTGRDEHSANADQLGTSNAPDDDGIVRTTLTSPVREIVYVS